VLEYEHRDRIFGLLSLFTSVSPVILEQCLEICTTFLTRLIVHKICYISILIYLFEAHFTRMSISQRL
jgi:hypothetical protein